MKKKHRRAVCFALNGAYAIILSPILLPLVLIGYIGMMCEWLIFDFVLKPCDWLKTKLRVYDN